MSSMPSYPDKLEITPLSRPPSATVRVPGSKSITNRALVLAALQGPDGWCELRGVLRSEDTEVMIECLSALGFDIQTRWSESWVRVGSDNCSNIIPAPSADLFVANSGTTMRFLSAMVSLGHGRYRLDGVPRMRERPIEDLLTALRQLGVNAYSERDNGCPPVVVEATGLAGGRVSIKGDVSSQFLSGLLMTASASQQEISIEAEGELVSWPYIAMTVRMMQQWGLLVETKCGARFRVPGGQRSELVRYVIEPDASAATYFWARLPSLAGAYRFPT